MAPSRAMALRFSWSSCYRTGATSASFGFAGVVSPPPAAWASVLEKDRSGTERPNVSISERSRKVGPIARAWGILFRTEVEWEAIDGESATVLGLFVGYACILAAIRPLAEIPQNLLLIHWKAAPTLEIMALRYAASLLGVFIVGLVINALAPVYHGEKNLVQAMKLSVYYHTPGWVVGFLYLMPIPGFLAMIGGLYGLYVLLLGLPTLMKSAREETAGYFVGVAFCGFVVGAVTNWAINMISLYVLNGAPLTAASATFGR
jgi:Yip1 domain